MALNNCTTNETVFNGLDVMNINLTGDKNRRYQQYKNLHICSVPFMPTLHTNAPILVIKILWPTVKRPHIHFDTLTPKVTHVTIVTYKVFLYLCQEH